MVVQFGKARACDLAWERECQRHFRARLIGEATGRDLSEFLRDPANRPGHGDVADKFRAPKRRGVFELAADDDRQSGVAGSSRFVATMSAPTTDRCDGTPPTGGFGSRPFGPAGGSWKVRLRINSAKSPPSSLPSISSVIGPQKGRSDHVSRIGLSWRRFILVDGNGDEL